MITHRIIFLFIYLVIFYLGGVIGHGFGAHLIPWLGNLTSLKGWGHRAQCSFTYSFWPDHMNSEERGGYVRECNGHIDAGRAQDSLQLLDRSWAGIKCSLSLWKGRPGFNTFGFVLPLSVILSSGGAGLWWYLNTHQCLWAGITVRI